MRGVLLTEKEKKKLRDAFNKYSGAGDGVLSIVRDLNIPNRAYPAALKYVIALDRAKRRKALNERVKSIIAEKGQAIIDDYRSGLTLGEVARKNSITSEETARVLMKGYKTKVFHYFVETAEELK